MFYTEEQLAQIKSHGLDLQTIENQLILFKNGFENTTILQAATVENLAIKQLLPAEITQLAAFFDQQLPSIACVVKFVPASGAATRMFEHLLNFFYQTENETPQGSVADFFNKLPQLACFTPLNQLLIAKKQQTVKGLLEQQDYKTILKYLLFDQGLNYSNLPKGLVAFHQYENEYRTAAQEHLIESMHLKDANGISHIHFTVSENHAEIFKNNLEHFIEQKNLAPQSFNLQFSFQNPSTDTIAATATGEPFVDKNGALVFRPGGHGALIENLNQINAPLIFIKNIDNVVHDDQQAKHISYRKAIGGYLLQIKDLVSTWYKRCKESQETQTIKEIQAQAAQLFCWQNLADLEHIPLKVNLLKRLKRPIRVCGMVKNIGQPGGGPFIAKAGDEYQPQIVEKAQIDFSNPDAVAIFNASTHFNPVDIACWKADPEGNLLNLTDFIDPHSVFISQKSKDGQTLQALEHPGLWNGAMAFWNTVFVEIPLELFAPVKQINDLANPSHQKN